jgi:hypothetical protein
VLLGTDIKRKNEMIKRMTINNDVPQLSGSDGTFMQRGTVCLSTLLIIILK